MLMIADLTETAMEREQAMLVKEKNHALCHSSGLCEGLLQEGQSTLRFVSVRRGQMAESQ